MSARGEGARVLQVLQPLDGGVARHVQDLSLGLVERGFEVEVAAAPGCVALPALRAGGVVVHELELRRAPGPADVRALRALRALDRARRFGIVHAHSSKAGALVRGALPRARRLVYTPHCFAFTFTSDLSAPERAVYRAVEQLLIARTGALVAVSEWEAETARRGLLGARARVATVPNGTGPCAVAEPDPELRALAGGEPLAVFVSKLRPEKNPLAVVRAAAQLHAAGELPGRVAIVGDGDLAPAVRDEIAARGVGEAVRWFPFGGSTAPYIAAADLLVVPSSWESLPITPLEAMACGVPVLATAVGGMPEAITDGRTGWLVPAGDEGALAGALRDLLGDRERLARAGAAARELVAERFRLDTMVDGVAALY
ncbi:MAG TPA: glycosyltransferase family 4 protein, partial [Gemmatimonadaceae bacterium]|nr:glycosyltransferase family 4 protein [Gemmatimonadaceae bacterium]